MLYHLLYPLSDQFSVLNVFKYITFRAAGAMLTALIVTIVFGPMFIRLLKRGGVKEKIREEGPKTHYAKAGTPTMGGLIILTAIIIPLLLWADLTNEYVQLMLFVTVWMGAIGFMDDYMKAILRHPKGMVGRYKLAGQIICGVIFGLVLYYMPPSATFDLTTEIPFVKDYYLDFKWLFLFLPFVVTVITGASNAVNLTDGLDGLATGLTGIAFLTFAAFAYVTGRSDFSSYLQITYLDGASELTVYCSASMGAAIGFLWYNSHPAEVFMGDTGALALGGALGAVAIMLKKELLLVIVGGVFVAEALSVILQVGSYRMRRVRIFKMAPLHHHFEQLGWPESKVVTRFWIVGAMCALLTLATLKVR